MYWHAVVGVGYSQNLMSAFWHECMSMYMHIYDFGMFVLDYM